MYHNLPHEVVHEWLCFLPLQDRIGYSLTCPKVLAYMAWFGIARGLDRYAKPISVHNTKQPHLDHVFRIRQNPLGFQTLNFRKQFLRLLDDVSPTTQKLILRCIYNSGEHDASAFLSKRLGTLPCFHRMQGLDLYRTLNWSAWLWSFVNQALKICPAADSLVIRSLPILVVDTNHVLVATSRVFLYQLLQTRPSTLTVSGSVYINTFETWSSDAIVQSIQDAVQEMSTRPWSCFRMETQKIFSSSTCNLGHCLFGINPPLRELVIQHYVFQEDAPSGFDASGLISYTASCTTLHRFELKNVIFFHGADLVQLGHALVRNGFVKTVSLRHVHCTFPPLEDVGLVLLQTGNITKLTIDSVSQPLQGPYIPSTMFDKIRSLHLHHSRLSFEGITTSCRNLVDLDLAYCSIHDTLAPKIAKSISRAQRLKRLSLHGNFLTFQGVLHIATTLKQKECRVEFLNLNDNLIGAPGLLVLLACPNLKVLRVCTNHIVIQSQTIHLVLSNRTTILRSIDMRDNNIKMDYPLPNYIHVSP